MSTDLHKAPKCICKQQHDVAFKLQIINWRNKLVLKKNRSKTGCLTLLPDLDSNQDKQNQNLRYYHYTIGHRKRKCKN